MHIPESRNKTLRAETMFHRQLCQAAGSAPRSKIDFATDPQTQSRSNTRAGPVQDTVASAWSPQVHMDGNSTACPCTDIGSTLIEYVFDCRGIRLGLG